MFTEKIKFHEISVQDREWMTERLSEEQPESCEYTFVSNFVWRKSYRVEVAQYAGCGVIRYCREGSCMYSFPFGNGDKKAVLSSLKELCKESGCKLAIYPVTEKYRNQLNGWFPGEFFIKSDRDDFDYIYLREQLADLKGRKFHGKRNHIARFQDGGDWSYEPITGENLEECRRMHREWIAFREDKWDSGVAEETEALQEAFDHYEEFGLVGGLIRRSSDIVAFCMGEPLNDETMVVHFEKAYPDMQGAYPMINQQFVVNECENFKYINREEDTGDPGLRKAKLSYYPDLLLKKYSARESHVTFAVGKELCEKISDDKNFEKEIFYRKSFDDINDIKKLWKTCFGDDEKYIDFYLKHRFDDENMMVIRESGKIVSMASFLPAAMRWGEKWISVKYVYAVATLPQYRKKGYAAEIIRFASEVYGEPLVLQPASEELRGYYGKIGFEEFFERDCREFEIRMDDLSDVLEAAEFREKIAGGISETISPEEYKKLRDSHFDRDGYLCWDEYAIEYALAENRFWGGRAVKVGENDVLLYRTEGNVFKILESTLRGEELKKAVMGIVKLSGDSRCRRAVYQNKGGMILFPKNTCDLAGQNENASETSRGYLSLTLG